MGIKNRDDKMLLAQNLRFLRKNANLTQKELTDLLSLNKSAITNIENKNIDPSLDTLVKIARFFNVSIDFLVGDHANTLISEGEDEQQNPEHRLPPELAEIKTTINKLNAITYSLENLIILNSYLSKTNSSLRFENSRLKDENQSLKTENKVLRNQISGYIDE